MPHVVLTDDGSVEDGGDPDVGELATVDQFPAVRLFLERARAVDASIDVTPRSTRAVVEVCRRLDGIPLAIELAAARVSVMAVEQIAARLDAEDLVWAPVQTPAEVAADPQVAAAGAFVDVEDGEGGAYRSPAAPARFPGADAERRPPYPGLGQHTAEVLAELGYSESQIAAMKAAGAAL